MQELIKLSSNKDYRYSKRKCVVAGTTLVRDLGKRYRFHELLSSRADDPALEGLRATSRYVADEKCLRRIAQLTHFDGLVATLDLPPRMKPKDLADPRLVLVLDYIEDPGLMGTLLRTAVAFQWQAVFLLPHCRMDPFDAPCLRASQGALFELPHCLGKIEDLKRLCRSKRLTLCVSHSAGTDIGSASYELPPNGLALLLREEYAAPWAPPREATKIRVPDPWRNSIEQPPDGQPFDPRSLDVAVAGGILMHHIKHFHYPHVSRSPYLASPGHRPQ